jgi:hypothetical protein
VKCSRAMRSCLGPDEAPYYMRKPVQRQEVLPPRFRESGAVSQT